MFRFTLRILVAATLAAMLLGGCVQSENGGSLLDFGSTNSTADNAPKKKRRSGKVPPQCERAEGVLAVGTLIKTGNFREKPSGKSKIIRQLQAGEKVDINGTEGRYYVVTAADGTKGYLYFTLVGVDVAECEYYGGTMIKASKVQTAPGSKATTCSLAAKTPVEVLSLKDGYYEISSEKGEGYVPVGTAQVNADKRTIYRSFNERMMSSLPFGLNGDDTAKKSTKQDKSKQKTGKNGLPAHRLELDGYAKEFAPFKTLYRQRRSRLLTKQLEIEDGPIRSEVSDMDEFVDEIGVLGSWERSLVALDAGNLDESLGLLGGAEAIVEANKDESYTLSATKSVGFGALGILTGNDELTPYYGESFEHVMMLNYKAISYLLKGDRSAYNVARRAIDLQNIEREKFEKAIAESKEKLEEQKKESEQKNKGEKDGKKEGMSLSEVLDMDFSKILSADNAAQNKRAQSVPSAFVNPFADYLNAMVLEIDGYEDRSQRSTAKITYSKGLALAPNCGVLKKAVKDMDKPAPSDKKLVHIILADGLAPYKKVKTTYIPLIATMPIALKQAVYVSDKTPVASADVVYGKSRYTLEPLADVEAMMLRFEKDAQPLHMLRIAAAVGRSALIQQGTKFLGAAGMGISALADEMACPDTRSWETLPSTISVQRLLLPKGADSVQVRLRSKSGTLDKVNVKLRKTGPTVIYCRSIDGKIVAQATDNLWI